jgi:hypothetical protein
MDIVVYILISAGMKFGNKKIRYGIPAYTGPFPALYIRLCILEEVALAAW